MYAPLASSGFSNPGESDSEEISAGEVEEVPLNAEEDPDAKHLTSEPVRPLEEPQEQPFPWKILIIMYFVIVSDSMALGIVLPFAPGSRFGLFYISV
jgi:hypothetical protein